MTNHTPGPWHRNIRAGGKYSTVFAGRNNHIAHVCQQSLPEETEANIDLVAAAPDLLNMLQRLMNEVMMSEAVFSRIAPLTLEQARNAISKATGETERALTR